MSESLDLPPTVIEETESFVEITCGKCNGEVSDDDDAILCDGLCQCWFNFSCTNLSDEELSGWGKVFIWSGVVQIVNLEC